MKIKNLKQYSYWRKREQAARADRMKSEAEIDKEIRSIYAEMADGIQKEIDSFYAKYAAENGITIAEAQRRASKIDMEEYERKAEKYVREQTFTEQANREMRLYNMTMKVNRLELLKSKIGLELLKGHSELERTLGEHLTQGVQAEFERLGGILGETVKNATKRAQGLVGASFKTARFSDRIWMSQDLLKAELSKLLRQGLIQSKSSIELARNLRKIMDVSQSNAERLMRTELTRVQIEAQKLSYKENDFDKYMYIALSREQAKPGQRACDVCEALDGQVFDVKDMEPGLNAPPMHPNCRCSTASAFMDPQEFDRWLDNQVDEMNGSGLLARGVERDTIGQRAMAGGKRRSVHTPLSEEDKAFILKEAKALGIDASKIEFVTGRGTAYIDSRDKIRVSSNVFPASDDSKHPTDSLSVRATLAHEYYGHRANRGTKLEPGAWNDEFRASYMAALYAPNLSDAERAALIADAMHRAREAGVSIKPNRKMRWILYGIK